MNQVISCPAVLIAAPASGQGKTTLTAALARLHARQGRRVRVFKCGPDYLDPWWHGLASGAAVQSLDLWMTGERDSRQRLAEAAKEADLILIEGVMGLFDGEPSAADLAEKFGLPIVVLMDGSSMAGTFGALAWGLQHFRPNLNFAGVLANRIGSDGHAQMLRDSLRPGLTWLGHLPRDAGFSLPERHLGLVAAHELPDALERLDRLADALEKTPLGHMDDSALQAWSVSFSLPECLEIPPLLAGKKIAIARDEAFCFIYPANLETLQTLGAELCFFSPLHDVELPECDALWLPGGYPELHAQRLSEHRSMHLSIRQHVDAGKPIWAECGGMMALFSELHDLDENCVPMWGIFPGATRMQKRLAGLGAQAISTAALWPDHTKQLPDLRGHTFHYSVAETPLQPAAYASNNTRKGEAIYVQGAVRGSYVHAYFPSSPSIVAALFGAVL